MSLAPRVEPLPEGVVALADHEACARARLPAASWAYLTGGAGDEITLRENRVAWDTLRLLPRVLAPLDHGHTRVELLGRILEHPILLAPVAYQQLAHPDGEIATAHAAAAQGAGLVLSTQSSVTLEQVAQAVLGDAGRGPLWFQLYFQPDRGVTQDLVRRAEAAGYEALVLTVDAAVHGARDAARRAGFRLPAGIHAANLQPYPQTPPAQGTLFEQLAHAPGWADVEWLVAQTRLPVLLKGVLHAQDARLAARAGVAGLIVSNHGGRTLDTAAATATVLPRIAAAVGHELPLLVDGGIRRGTDVLKALALGARAVLVGQPLVWALGAAGAVGVAHMLRLLRDELGIAMVLCGCATPAEASRELLLSQPAHPSVAP